MPNTPNKKPPLKESEAVKVQQISTGNSITEGRQQAIIQLFKLIHDDPQARHFLVALLEELDQEEANA